MALSEHEQRQLDEMETALLRDDPNFAASISIDRVRRRRIVAALLFVLGMVVLVAGLVATAETVLIGVLVSAVGLSMMVAAAIAVLRRRHS
jgi:Protein of unknown function (DUF3040)